MLIRSLISVFCFVSSLISAFTESGWIPLATTKFMRMIIQRLPSRHDNDNNDENDLVELSAASKQQACAGYTRGARVFQGLMLQDGQNYVYLRHVYMERPAERDSRLKLSSCQAQPIPTRVIIEIFRAMPHVPATTDFN